MPRQATSWRHFASATVGESSAWYWFATISGWRRPGSWPSSKFRWSKGETPRAVDLFPVRHAEKVLTAFGRAFGALPDRAGSLAREQRLFVEQAVAGLAQDGKVICVRLALFAQMMKDRPWTPASLRGVGGALGVGVTFLEETFSASTAPAEHRYHQDAARAILKALLPDAGTDIKGYMRSQAELLAVSGYAGRPAISRACFTSSMASCG